MAVAPPPLLTSPAVPPLPRPAVPPLPVLQVVKKGVQSNLLVAYMFHEIDEAAEAVEAGETDAKTGEGGGWWGDWYPVRACACVSGDGVAGQCALVQNVCQLALLYCVPVPVWSAVCPAPHGPGWVCRVSPSRAEARALSRCTVSNL